MDIRFGMCLLNCNYLLLIPSPDSFLLFPFSFSIISFFSSSFHALHILFDISRRIWFPRPLICPCTFRTARNDSGQEKGVTLYK